jgi:hypothetical protein
VLRAYLSGPPVCILEISATGALDKALDKESFVKLPAIARALGPEAALTT